ncbi:MAG: tetratricopeptide repeat protein [Planctomycetota bacterium]
MLPARSLAPLLLALAASCSTNQPAEPSTGGDPSTADPALPGDRAAEAEDFEGPGDIAAAIRALRAGDLDAANAVIDGLLVERAHARALNALEANDPALALISIDELLAADHPEAVELKAEASLALAEATIASGGNGLLIQGALDDARKHFERIRPATVASRLGAARSAWLLNDARAAADHARAALSRLEEVERARLDPELLERALRLSAEASFGAYRTVKSDPEGTNHELARSRFDETETALSALLVRTPDDPWVWQTLADLYEWEGMHADARAIAERGLERLKDDAGLWERLGRVARNSGGRLEAADALDAASAAAPDSPLGHWYRAFERFEYAVDAMHAGEDTSEDFRAAEAAFQRTAELDPTRAEAALGYRVMCRAGLGWCAYDRGDWAEARRAFVSMNDAFDGGIAWSIEDRLGSGLVGLEFVGVKLNEAERWDEAGALFRELYELSSAGGAEADPRHANNAGFFLRDAAVEEELLARRLCTVANGGEVESRERLLAEAGLAADADAKTIRAASNERLARARTWMEESATMYAIAARAMPEDVRVVNDAALIHVYYLYTELDWAEEQLLRLVDVGREQLADESLAEDARWELENAWGDVFQNLGVLWATQKSEPEEALTWFQRAVEIGPEPRPMITNLWVPFVEGTLEPDASFAPLAQATWGAPCNDPVTSR